MIDDDLVFAHRRRALNPDRPVVRGVAQNPDVYFQGRETVNPYYAALPGHVQTAMDRFAALTGRQYTLFDYFGVPDADRVLVLMGSGAETAREAIESPQRSRRQARTGAGAPVPAVFSRRSPRRAFRRPSRSIAVLDRTKEPGADGRAAVSGRRDGIRRGRRHRPAVPRCPGSSVDATACRRRSSRRRWSRRSSTTWRRRRRGITSPSGSTTTSRTRALSTTATFVSEGEDVVGCVFYGLGADGTVGANKNSIKIIGEETVRVRAGLLRLRLEEVGVEDDIAPAVRAAADSVDLPRAARPLRRLSPVPVRRTRSRCCAKPLMGRCSCSTVRSVRTAYGTNCRASMQAELIRKRIRLYVIDADTVATDAGMAGRVNTIMQTCFFAISGVLPREEAIRKIKGAIEATYGRKGSELVEQNFAAVDRTLEHLFEVPLPSAVSSSRPRPPVVPPEAPAFVRQVTAMMMAGRGDELPVSALPADGTYPSGTTRGRSGIFRTRCRSGSRLSASSAAIARWSVRTRSSGFVTTTSRCWRRRQRDSRPRRSPAAASRICGSRCRWLSKTAPAVSCALKSVRREASKRPGSVRSTWSRQGAAAGARAPRI